MMRSLFPLLTLIDDLLPRKVASIPYQLALETLGSSLSRLPGVEVWARNSYRKGNFVFGLSDLDLTIYLHAGYSSRILEILESQKRLFPFLGEANFYISDLEEFLPMANFFEVQRDPELLKRIHIHRSDLHLERASYLLRHLFADREKLLRNPEIRQKKWKEHFRELGFDELREINFQNVVEAIEKELNLGSELEEGLEPLKHPFLTDDMMFNTPMPQLWKFLFPNKHLWERENLENFRSVSGTIVGKVCLKQIEWEIWGLMTQFPYLERASLERHVTNLMNVAEILDPPTKITSSGKALINLLNRRT